MQNDQRVVLTGFMGVGKSSVARHLCHLLNCGRIDLDSYIEKNEGRKIHEIFATEGEEGYRQIETASLGSVLDLPEARIISLGGGAWTIKANREMISDRGLVSVWLESTFDHCWQNISRSRKERPLAKNKDAARKLFEERRLSYALADWHFIVRPGFSSFEIAQQIEEQVFS